MLPGCLRSLRDLDEVVVVVDTRTQDRSAEVARELGAEVILHEFRDFSDMKNAGIAQARGVWVLMVDADERASGPLRTEVLRAVQQPHGAFEIRCENIFFGRKMRSGTWGRDWHVRLFRNQGVRYRGAVHEEPFFDTPPTMGRLRAPLIHLSHRSIKHSTYKTLNYADVQAAEMLAQNHPPVTARTLAKVVSTEFIRRMIKGRAWRDGMAGVIEAFYQPFSLFVVHVRLWEMQQTPTLEDLYEDIERRLD
jgi:Glycosyl transferase family 2